MAGKSITVLEGQKMARTLRRPVHTFQVRHRPFEITPFLIAPVLPGETVKNVLIQSRAITDPIKSQLQGWWLEYYLFYVKHRDLPGRDDFTAMMLNPDQSLSAYVNSSVDAWKYAFDDGIDWTAQCLQRVTETYFRASGEAWDDFVITAGRPAAQINNDDWMDSVVDETTLPDVSAESTSSDVALSDLEKARIRWEFMREQGFTNASYEDFLRTYGVRPDIAEQHKPELIRYLRDWQYPVSAIDPTDGSAASAVRWSIGERADKDRFIKEPGFVFGVTLARPKVYRKNQTGSMAHLLNDAYSWLPATLADSPEVSLKTVAAGEGPLQSTTNAYVVDVRDLFVHGDQFVNFALSEADASLVALPSADLANKRYPASSDVDALFAAASPANQVRQDGVVHLSIAGRQWDTTPTREVNHS